MTSSAGRPKIVVAWDGSAVSAQVLPLAGIIGAQIGADIEILHVLIQGSSAGAVGRYVRAIGLERFHVSRLRVEAGEVAQKILAAAEESDVVLLVLTTHVDSIREGRHLGSVAQAVVVGANSPVLLVRPEAGLAYRELRRLLLPVDGTPKTAAALQPATELAKHLGASVDLLYVAGPSRFTSEERGSIGAPRYVDQQQHDWPNWATEAAERLARCCANCPPEVPVQVFLTNGNIADEIERFATEHASDAIVLVRRSRLQTGRATTLRRVLERAPCPVLVLSGPEIVAHA